jgi:hypothetical protein
MFSFSLFKLILNPQKNKNTMLIWSYPWPITITICCCSCWLLLLFKLSYFLLLYEVQQSTWTKDSPQLFHFKCSPLASPELLRESHPFLLVNLVKFSSQSLKLHMTHLKIPASIFEDVIFIFFNVIRFYTIDVS